MLLFYCYHRAFFSGDMMLFYYTCLSSQQLLLKLSFHDLNNDWLESISLSVSCWSTEKKTNENRNMIQFLCVLMVCFKIIIFIYGRLLSAMNNAAFVSL